MLDTILKEDDHYLRVLLSLRRSRVRKDALKFLAKLHSERSYAAEIAREIGSTPSNVRCALSGAPWGDERFNGDYSLVSLGLVDVKKINGRRYYKTTEEGLEVAKNLEDKL